MDLRPFERKAYLTGVVSGFPFNFSTNLENLRRKIVGKGYYENILNIIDQ